MASSLTTSWQIGGERTKTMTDFIFFGSNITADGDCSHKIKRCLFLGTKAMTNVDSILKSRDDTLLSKVHLVKAMVFPIVVYGCESCTIEKDEHWGIDAFKLWCWRRFSRVLKIIHLEHSLEGLILPLQCFGHLIRRTDSLEKTLLLGKIEGRRRRVWQRRRWLVNITNSMEMSLRKLCSVGDGQGSLVCCSPCVPKESDNTEWLNWTK